MIEMLITGFLAGIVSLAALSFYQSQHSQLLQQNEVVDVQQNLRATMAEVTRQVRQAGYLAEGALPVQVMGSKNDMLLVRYHDGDTVRSQIFYVLRDSIGRAALMTQLDGEAPMMFAENIDSISFASGGVGGNIDWVRVDLVARTKSAGFRSVTPGVVDKHLFRRLSSLVKLRNG